MRKMICMMLAVSSLFSLLGGAGAFASSAPGRVPAEHQPTGKAVKTVEEFLSMDPEGDYYLANDLDFSDKVYSKSIYPGVFKGRLDGNGHALTGVTVKGANADAGIFASGFAGTIENLTVGSADRRASVTATGGSFGAGAIAASFDDGAVLRGVMLFADVKSGGRAAGITAEIKSGSVRIERCETSGSVTGNPAAGFVCLPNGTGSSKIAISDSINRANVTAGNLSAGGFFAVAASVDGKRRCDLSVRGCINFGSVSGSDWRVGGIVGEFCESSFSTLLVEYCCNIGAVTMTGGGGFAAGIVGGMAYQAPSGERTVRYCYNAGTVRNTVTGVSYGVAYASFRSDKITVEHCAYPAGIAGSANAAAKDLSALSDRKSVYGIAAGYPASEDGLYFCDIRADAGEERSLLSWQLSAHGAQTVYPCGRTVCADCGAVLSAPDAEHHTFEEQKRPPLGRSDGYTEKSCVFCGEKIIAADTKSEGHTDPVDGVYRFSTAEQFLWFRDCLKAGIFNGEEHIEILSDLDFSTLSDPETPGEAVFSGQLDGGAHCLKGLSRPLFDVLGDGAVISRLALADFSVASDGDCGAISRRIGKGAFVKLTEISLCAGSVTASDAAGAAVGSSGEAMELTVRSCSVDGVVLSGKTGGGVVGSGDCSVFENCYVNAEIKAEKCGSLAYHTKKIVCKNCGWHMDQTPGKTDGKKTAKEAFSSGEAAYLINSCGRSALFGVENGRTAIAKKGVVMVRDGQTKVYTGDTIGAKEDLSYMIADDGTVVFVVKKNGSVRLVDSEISLIVGGAEKPVLFSELTLCRYIKSGGKYYAAAEDCALYAVKPQENAQGAAVNGKEIPRI